MNNEIRKLQILNDLIAQTLDVLHGRGPVGMQNPGVVMNNAGLSHTQYQPMWNQNQPMWNQSQPMWSQPVWNQGLNHTGINHGFGYVPQHQQHQQQWNVAPHGMPVWNTPAWNHPGMMHGGLDHTGFGHHPSYAVPTTFPQGYAPSYGFAQNPMNVPYGMPSYGLNHTGYGVNHNGYGLNQTGFDPRFTRPMIGYVPNMMQNPFVPFGY